MFHSMKDITLNSFTVAHLEYTENSKYLIESETDNTHIGIRCYKLYLQVYKVSFYYNQL